MSWAAQRQTTREEDSAYCLLGLFDVNMPLLHGEGNKAFLRFQEEIMKVSTDLSILLWQGTASAKNGMLAAAPSCFSKDVLSSPVPSDHFKISQGWTTNNAGIKVQLYVYPYMFTRYTEEIFFAGLGDSYGGGPATIFLEKLRETQATTSYRRVTINGKSWSSTQNKVNSLGSRQQVFITREALTDYSTTDCVRGCLVTLELPPAANCTARYGLAANHLLALKDAPILSPKSQGKVDCFFPIETTRTDLSLFGHITIQLACGADILMCFGFDRTFRAICIVLPLCMRMYEQRYQVLSPSSVTEGLHKLCSEPNITGDYFDSLCEAFAVSCIGDLGGSHQSQFDLESIGIYFKVSTPFSGQFQVTLRLDDHKFVQHYFPGQPMTMRPDDETIWEASAALQDKLEAPRRKLFGRT